jgi:cobalamin biosynthesis Co2+ chelatase CbiK
MYLGIEMARTISLRDTFQMSRARDHSLIDSSKVMFGHMRENELQSLKYSRCIRRLAISVMFKAKSLISTKETPILDQLCQVLQKGHVTKSHLLPLAKEGTRF